MRYTIYVRVRGGCSHAHGTIAGAERCLAEYQRDCRSSGTDSYSDRSLVYVGEAGYLFRDEACTDRVAKDGGRTAGAVVFSPSPGT